MGKKHFSEEQIAFALRQAGRLGRVTVATNMAGRGTDIRLDEGAAELGGLHDSARIDRQFIGRAGRQGDPGSYRFIFYRWKTSCYVMDSGRNGRQGMRT